MSPNEVTGAQRCPVSGSGKGSLTMAAMAGAVVAVGVFFAARLISSPWSNVGEPAACVGHFFFVFIVGLSLADALTRRNRLAELQSEADLSVNKSGIWNEAVAACRESESRFSTGRLPDVFRWVVQCWNEIAGQRAGLALIVAAFPVFAGFVEGTRHLRLEETGSYLPGFAGVYFPMVVGTLESAAAGAVIMWNRWQWIQVFELWNQAACATLRSTPEERMKAAADSARQGNSPAESGKKSIGATVVDGETSADVDTVNPEFEDDPEGDDEDGIAWDGEDPDEGMIGIPKDQLGDS